MARSLGPGPPEAPCGALRRLAETGIYFYDDYFSSIPVESR